MQSAPMAETRSPQLPNVSYEETETTPPAGMRKAVFTLSEGDVVLVYPEELSSESVADLEDYLKVAMRKIRREAGLSPSKDDKPTN